ncbi:MAG: hypothetical protein R2733_16500 [Acidimicrobiales bacterium]
MSSSLEISAGTSRRQGGPSRLDTRRQQKIANMVDGYRSTATIAAALRNVFLIWTIPSVALVLLGVLALERHRYSSVDDVVTRSISALQVALSLLSFATFVGCVVFAVLSWNNVRCVGKSTRIKYWDIAKRHISAFAMGIVCFVVSIFFADLAPIFLVVAVLLWAYSGMFMWSWLFEIVRMLWRSGSPPVGYEDELPHWGIVWMVALVTYFGCNGYDEIRAAQPKLFAILTIISGVSAFVAAALASRLVVAISQRHDARLTTILTQLDADSGNDGSLVTTKQIESAWERSQALVSFDI